MERFQEIVTRRLDGLNLSRVPGFLYFYYEPETETNGADSNPSDRLIDASSESW